MALITTIDCERLVPNRFELVLLAVARARALSRGETPHVSPDGDKSTVIALREIAAGTVDPIRLRQQMLKLKSDDVEEDDESDRPGGTARIVRQGA
jgi:DNA-directed RNA polymerase subunit omega